MGSSQDGASQQLDEVRPQHTESNSDTFTAASSMVTTMFNSFATSVSFAVNVKQDAEPAGMDGPLLYYFQLSVENHIPMLKGEVNPLELLFPEGNWSTAESLFQSNPLMEYHNNIACHILRTFGS